MLGAMPTQHTVILTMPRGSDLREADRFLLRNRDWVEGNLKKVDEATNGRVAYVYVPNTAGAGHTYFKRYFYPQATRQAVIVDERFNGGGSVADYYIDILRRPFIAHWAMRYGADLPTPFASIQGPKAMIIDETAGSGGDLLPWMFRKFDMGPLIGKRTWGGLVHTAALSSEHSIVRMFMAFSSPSSLIAIADSSGGHCQGGPPRNQQRRNRAEHACGDGGCQKPAT